jgi:DNA polymerase-3 subunit epsilon/CBS domain-containing protein
VALSVGSRPLIAIDAVAFDTETTSLDAARARIVQVGAVRVRGGRLVETETLDWLINPQEPIPAASTRVHQIRDQDVRGVPDFSDRHEDLTRFVGSSVLIGHSVGFDLAVWRNEARRAGFEWIAPRALCTRMLAEIANPKLPGFSLEIVSAWLEIEVKDRHAALGDAFLAARVFTGLIPHLRQRDIRTVAEAEAACRKLTESLTEQHKAGWIEPTRLPSGERSLARIDSYPYRHRIRDVMSTPPLIASTALSLAEAARLMADRRVSSVFLADTPPAPDAPPLPVSALGVLTERDVLRAVARHGASALGEPVSTLMSRPVAAVPADAFLYRAIGRMARLRIRHLAVMDESGRLVGALSQRDLLKLRAEEAISLGDEIDTATDEAGLAAAWAKLPAVAGSLVSEGVPAHDVAGVISRELGALTRRAATLAETRMLETGRGRPPVPYAVLVLGSGGRGESLLAADQDNAIVFTEGAPGSPTDQWFAELGDHIAQILNAAGLPFCKGGVMARNAAWRGSLDTWRDRVEGWVRRSRPQDLLSVDIFFDLRPVHGDFELGGRLIRDAFALGAEETGFAKLLAEAAGDHRPPLTFLGNIRTEEGRVDLKLGALLPIVSTARCLAIRHAVQARSTVDRIEGVKALRIGSDSDLDHLIKVHRLVIGLVLEQQLDDVENGVPLSARIALKALPRDVQDRLRLALGRLNHLADLTRTLLFAEPVADDSKARPA